MSLLEMHSYTIAVHKPRDDKDAKVNTAKTECIRPVV